MTYKSFYELCIGGTEQTVDLLAQQLNNVDIMFGNGDAREAYRQCTMSAKQTIGVLQSYS